MRRIIILLLSSLLFLLPLGTQAQQLPPVDPTSVNGDITITGSPVLEGVTSNLATRFALEGYSGLINVASNTTSEGFQQLCRGETDIVMSDRAISPQETDSCTATGRPPVGFRVATSAIIVAVANGNTFANNLTSAQLQQIFGTALTWSEVNPAWTQDAIARYGSPIDSAPFNLFVTTVFGGDRSQLVTAVGAQFTDDPGVRLNAIATSTSAIGFFDANYALENTNILQGVTIDGVAPNINTIADNSYPLSRPLLIYTTSQDFTQDPQVASFINYYLSNVTQEVIAEGLSRAPESGLATARNRWLTLSGQASGSVSAPAPQTTEAAGEPALGTIDDISATATALASVVTEPQDERIIEITPTPAPEIPGAIFDLETQDLLLQARLDLEVTAEEVIGGGRPEGWTGSLDIQNPQLPLLIRLDLEVLAAAVYGIDNRPDDWFGAVSSTQSAITRDIRHDLEILAEDVFGTVRPANWIGGDPLLSCDRSTQALVELLQKNGLYTLTADPVSLDYCRQVAIEISRFVEVNFLSTDVAIGAEGVDIPAAVSIGTTIAVGFYNTSATQRAGVIPVDTGITPIARSYLGFSNMTLVEGDDFLLFVEWQNTSLTLDEWLALPNVLDFEFTPSCSERWCELRG